MLPLWIIDITHHSERQTHFSELIGKLNGVVKQDDLQSFLDNNDSEGVYVHKKEWYYSHIDSTFVGIDSSDNEAMAEAVYRFQEKVIAEGQNFVKMLRHANVDSAATLNVCVIADITEQLTHYIFPSMAVMLQKEKERILPNHIHQGMSIVGMPFLPSNVNNFDAQTRQSILLTIKEIEIQHNITAVRGYDRMFFYQDVQNRTENYYPQLDSKGVAEYLHQCLIHLYYACDKVHPLINGGSSDERFYFTLGVSSLFFDTETQDLIDNRNICNGIITQFKEKGVHEEEVEWDQFVDFSVIDTKEITSRFANINFDLTQIKMDRPKPHPIEDFFDRKLKRLYFNQYLRFYPANLRLKQIEVIANESERALMDITAIRKRMQENIEEMVMPAAIERQIARCDSRTGALPIIKENLISLKNRLGKMKGRTRQQIENDIWQQIIKENVPHQLQDDFEAYHDSYTSDINRSSSHLCQEMKETALSDFINTLKQEVPLLGRISRSFILGLTLVLGFLPFLVSIMPGIKNSSDIVAGILFSLPIIEQLIEISAYNYQRSVKKRKLNAYFLHDAYARIANRIHNEMNCLYDNFMSLCDEYIDRCKLIDTEIQPFNMDDIYSQMELPVTRFNQPIIGGSFGDKQLMPYEKDESEEIYINRVPTKINTLDEEDKCILIHQYKQTLMELFSDVKIPTQLERRFDEKKGYKVFVNQEEKKEVAQQQWNISKETFFEHLSQCVRKDILPRRNPTIGDKLRFYANKNDQLDLIEPAIKYAATNGEITCAADQELADVKSNLRLIQPLLEPFLPKFATQFQFDEHKQLFEKYLFITRWRTFDDLALNRVLPTEDFDPKIMEKKVNQEEQIHLTNMPSSYILWAMCKEDNSKEWLKLFDATAFNEARQERDIYRLRLNKKD